METPVEYNAEKKEEMICIAKMIDKGEDKDLKHFKIYSRQEAIEKMAKGMYLKQNHEDTKYADFYSTYFTEFAEAALNALLEE